MKRKNKVRSIFILISIIIIIIFLPSIRLKYQRAMNQAFIETVENSAVSATIKIVQIMNETGFNSISTSVSAGGSGVIIHKEGNRYFALTANHVIKELPGVDQTEIIVMAFDDLDVNKDNMWSGVVNHYKQFPEATVEYTSEKYDLALISFLSDEDYVVLSLAEDVPKYGDHIATISNPYGKINIVTAGTIKNKKNWTYEDQFGKFKYSIVNHSALTSEGSSGSALINEELEIVGINLGGNVNLLRQFVSGMAIPVDQIRIFLSEWKGVD